MANISFSLSERRPAVMCRCELCGPVSRNDAEFEVGVGRLDRPMQVCLWCRQDLSLAGVVNQSVPLPRRPRRPRPVIIVLEAST